MENNWLIRGGTLVFPEGMIRQDLYVSQGRILAIGDALSVSGETQIWDADGKLVLPGCVDPHVHFALRVGETISCDDFSSGSLSALHGGITTLIDYTDPAPGRGLLEAFRRRRAEADGRIFTDYSLHAVLTDWTEETRAAMQELVQAGVRSVKLFMVYSQRVCDENFLAVLAASRELGFLVTAHCESAPLLAYFLARVGPRFQELGMRGHALSRPDCVEAEAVARACALATALDAPLHVVHLSSAAALEELLRFRRRNRGISAETAPHYLSLTDECFDRSDGHYFACCPQIKGVADRSRLRQGLQSGELSFVATDHCAYTEEEKNSWQGDFRRVPQGLPGVETSLPVVYTEMVLGAGMSLPELVDVMAARPARRFGLYPRKGSLLPGSDADILIVDPRARRRVDGRNLVHPAGWSPFSGRELAGFPEQVFLRGRPMLGPAARPEPEGRYLVRTMPEEV